MVIQADPALSTRTLLRILGLLSLGSASLVMLGASPARAECAPNAPQCWDDSVQSRIEFDPLATWKRAPDATGNGVNALANGFVSYGDPEGTLGTPRFNNATDPLNGAPVSGSQYGYFAGATGLNWLLDQGPPESNVGYTSDQGAGTRNANFATSTFNFTGGSNCAVCGLTFQLDPGSSTLGTRNITSEQGNTRLLLNSPTLTYIALFDNNPTGQTIALQYDANFLIRNDDITRPGGGSVRFFSNTSSTVPGPLPILGASTAFAFSRKLRRRVAAVNASKISDNTLA
jgi:hypothetical protein